MKNKTKGFMIRRLADAIAIAPPLAAAATQMPVWVQQGESTTISGTFLIIALCACLPFMKQIIAKAKAVESPDIAVLSGIIGVACFGLHYIALEAAIVFTTMSVSNFTAKPLYAYGYKVSDKLDILTEGTQYDTTITHNTN